MSPIATILLQYYWELLHQKTSLFQSYSHTLLLLLLFIIVVLVFVLISFKNTNSQTRKLNLPPSPSNKLPIIGHLHQLGSLPHCSLQSLAQKHGPDLMMIHLGSSPTIVVSSPQAAKEIMKTHDLIFSGRPNQICAKRLLYDGKDLAFTPYGEYWKHIRRICILQLLSAHRVQSFRSVREEEIKLMIQKISTTSCNISDQVVKLGELILALTDDILCRAAFGRKYTGDQVGKKFGQMKADFMYSLGAFNVGDFIPWLGWVNHFNGLNARTERCFREMDCFYEQLIEDRIENKKKRDQGRDEHEYKEDFVDVLLGINVDKENSAGLVGDGSLGRDSIKAIILDMFVAGTDTSHSVLVWAMTELMKQPKIMKQVQQEIREIVKGRQNVTEDDLNKMHYLQCIIKETLRLHPPAPLLLPRESTGASKIHGYDIPAKTRVIINAYAIGRDPETWKDPNKFEPERFMNSNVDYKGHDFEFIPFGAGRRGCPGIAFATAIIELALANLLFRFDWKLSAADTNGTDIDMSEAPGLVVHMKSPLLLVATDHYYICNY